MPNQVLAEELHTLIIRKFEKKSLYIKYMTLISKNTYIDKLGDIVNRYNSTYHNTIKMKPVILRQPHILVLL